MWKLSEISLIFILAALVDYLVADPQKWLHPVQVIGWFITKFSNWLIAQEFTAQSGDSQALNFKSRERLTPNQQRAWGVILGITVIVETGLCSWLLIYLTGLLNVWLKMIVEIVLLASCFATRSLNQAAIAVIEPLQANNLSLARTQLSQYVGRDTEKLSQPDILRAVVETVAENTTDGVTAPLFYALVGSIIPGLGPVPLAMAYKAASTLDSMIGYRRLPYLYIGWFSAKLEDILTWVPCRLTVVTLAIISGKPRRVWEICRRDAPLDPSPNSGWSESVYAAILGVQLGGMNTYKGVKVSKPLLGDAVQMIEIKTVFDALQLTRICFLTWLGVYLLTGQFILLL